MRNLKKILALALSLVMMLSVMSVAGAAFTDAASVSADYSESVAVLSGMGVFEGYEDGSFKPQGPITRAEVAAIIYRIVTGDVDDKQDGIYADYIKFEDVPATHWAAGYIGYCANAELVYGYGNDKFGPSDKVTGYQALAMILRAVGYDQNGEFTGNGWETRVASTAQALGILKNVSINTLGVAATRELVAEVLFQTVAYVNNVVYTPALGYYTTALLPNNLTYTLGSKNFGLTKLNAYVVGNQATGEAATKVAATPNGSVADSLTYTSGLEMFGHNVTGWYCSKTTAGATYGDVFYLVDNGASATVTRAEYLALADTAEYFSNSYGVIDAIPAVWDYNVLVTNPGEADVLVRLNLDIAQYKAINNYTSVPYLVVKSGSVNADQVIYLANASGYETIALGTYVNVLTVTGTNALNKAYPQKQLSALGVISGVSVKYVDTIANAITLSNGSVVKSSSTTHKAYAANVNAKIAVPNAWNFAATYTIYTDLFGNYVAATEQNNDLYAKITYAYYLTDPAAGEHTYYAQIVKNDGSIETVKLAVDAAGYQALTCNKLTWSGNSVTTTSYMDVVLTPTAAGYAITHVQNDGHCASLAAVVKKVGLNTLNSMSGTISNSDPWVVTKNTTVVDGAGNNNYFVDANTKFVVVGGYGSTLTVSTYNGVAELLGNNVAATINGKSVVTYTQVYSANITSENYHVDYVLIESAELTPASSLLYLADATPVGYYDTIGNYNVYFNGVAGQVPAVANGVVLADNTFYSYQVVNGVYVLSAATAGRIEDYTLTKVAGTAYLYVNDANSKQYPITESAVIVNLTADAGVPTTAAGLMIAAENNTIKVDVELVGGAVSVVYVYSYN